MSLSKWLQIALFTLLMASFSVSFTVKAAPISMWQSPYKELILQTAKVPSDVLQKLLTQTSTPEQSDLQHAQHHSALSIVYYALTYPNEALEHARTALTFIDPSTQPWLFHMTKLNEARALELSGKPKEGLIACNAALVWAELNNDINLRVSALYVRGLISNSLVDYQGALHDLQMAYDLAPQSELHSRGDIAGVMALVYEYRREDALAIPFFEEAVNFHKQNQNYLELSVALYGLGRANKNIDNLEIGRSQLQQSLTLAQQVGDEQGVAYALKELAGIALSEHKFLEARSKLQQASHIFQKSQNMYMLLDTNLSLLRVALAEKNLELGKQYLAAAKSNIDPEQMPLQNISLEEMSAKLLALEGKYRQAFELLDSTVRLKQRILSQQSTQQLHSLRSLYEIEIKDRENKLLEQKNLSQQISIADVETKNLQLLMLFGATLIICGLLIVLVYRTIQNRTKLEKLANVDGLTGLANRRHALELLQQQIELARRHRFQLSVAIIDIDLFKKINDTFGHASGDEVLTKFGELCLDTFRQTDVIGRIGGEEFVIAFPHTSIQDAQKTLKSLSVNVKKLPISFDLNGLTLSISTGLTAYLPGMTLESLMLQCDSALYQAKGAGRDQIVVFDDQNPSSMQLAL
ncbi:GGDEF domain-containing protein [Aliiglaciecola sp. 3_MG-2023]|uniref:tetratricopeptide repeat-containing diguanylate cyclase n=1 Tax=Aliiglaciecola sp. 3_MG-2023 TaxID=3062644 RepID=UPI0026E418AB|nr:GGDEF domain-containing protein [Aliiglaciecola sp. 3_MG-2023]MDO6694126.1 GGDEF domain-containing protein [Aliiglaciecola sp. 3_MG-2023]